ncbi:MAG: DnaJ domain-containing protein [Desulfobacteraceae bacterium]|jgi:DnaJ-class molecular chaperone|nr:DnaJ domain-containing protein [Desulfobacteraceae bacterium]
MQQDYYQDLGIPSTASEKQIKEAFRKLAFRYHPDRNQDDAAASVRMKAINEAYAVLSDPKKRGEYDALRNRFGQEAYSRYRQARSDQDIFRGSDVNEIFEEMARSFGLRGFDEIFRDFYGSQYRSFSFRGPGGFRGKGAVFFGTFGRGGPRRGILKGLARTLLDSTGMRGAPRKGQDINDEILLSEETAAAGGPYAYRSRARGKKLIVKIPPGIRQGQRIRLAGMGKRGRGGGPAGDLYLRVKIRRPLLRKMRRWIGLR